MIRYLLGAGQIYAMHISEGFLPKLWALIWFLAFIPFLILSIRKITVLFKDDQTSKLLFALMAAFAFTLSALKIPSIVGSSSHPTGMGLGAILLGPTSMVVVGTIVLILQALLIAHGGITTLGANAFSMAVVGPFVSFGVFHLLKKMKVNNKVSVFLAASLGSLSTYFVTSLQLGLAFTDGNLLFSVAKFLGVFMFTQVPIAIAEGVLTVVVYNLLSQTDQFETFVGGTK